MAENLRAAKETEPRCNGCGSYALRRHLDDGVWMLTCKESTCGRSVEERWHRNRPAAELDRLSEEHSLLVVRNG